MMWFNGVRTVAPVSQSPKGKNRREPPTFVACVGKEDIRQLGRLQ